MYDMIDAGNTTAAWRMHAIMQASLQPTWPRCPGSLSLSASSASISSCCSRAAFRMRPLSLADMSCVRHADNDFRSLAREIKREVRYVQMAEACLGMASSS